MHSTFRAHAICTLQTYEGSLSSGKSSSKRKQRVHIECDLVGFIFKNELIKAEQTRPRSCLFQEVHILLFHDRRVWCPILLNLQPLLERPAGYLFVLIEGMSIDIMSAAKDRL